MTVALTDPRQDHDWLDAGFTPQEAAEWGFTLTVRTGADADGWRSPGWDVADVVDLEANLVQDIGQSLFQTGGQAELDDAVSGWRAVGLDFRFTIICLQAGLSIEEAANFHWDENSRAAVETLSDIVRGAAGSD